MIKKLTLLFFILFFSSVIYSQSVTEKELFSLTYEGDADVYNFVYDTASGSYCYLYRIEAENKYFIISNNSISQKYDYVGPDAIKFDSMGNYYAVTSNYKPDYGIDNYFLIANGKEVENYNFIDAYSDYVTKKGELVFIFQENDLYKLGYYSPDNGFRQSDGFESIRTLYKYDTAVVNRSRGDEEEGDPSYYVNENGERGFVANAIGKTKLIFETSELSTDYDDIYESSLTRNKNNELSFYAKKGAKFFQKTGNEFVVSGNKEYDKFGLVSMPLLFNNGNEPVYTAGDSLSEGKYDYYSIIGNEKQKVYEVKSNHLLDFNYYLAGSRIDNDGELRYFGVVDSVIPAVKKYPEEDVYDQFYSRTFYVKGNKAYELGYNVGNVKYDNRGNMLYSGMADLNKKESLLMLNYGDSRIILSKGKFEDIYDYGFSPNKDVYFAAQTYDDVSKGTKNRSYLYLGDKLIGEYDYLSYSGVNGNSSIIVFDNSNNYAFVAQRIIDSLNTENIIVTNGGKLPFPDSKVPGAKKFSYVSNLMFSSNDKMFYVGEMAGDTTSDKAPKELFVDNVSTGNVYNTIGVIKYDPSLEQVSFIGTRGSKIYLVTVQF